jgi:hypothetical protein
VRLEPCLNRHVPAGNVARGRGAELGSDEVDVGCGGEADQQGRDTQYLLGSLHLLKKQ